MRFHECKGGDPDIESWMCSESGQGQDAVLSTDVLGEKERRNLFGEYWRFRWTVTGGSFDIFAVASARGWG